MGNPGGGKFMKFRAIIFVVAWSTCCIGALHAATNITIVTKGAEVAGAMYTQAQLDVAVSVAKATAEEAAKQAVSQASLMSGGAALVGFIVGGAIGYYAGREAGHWLVNNKWVSSNLPADDNASDDEESPEVAARHAELQLDYALYAYSMLSASQPHAIIDDVITKIRVVLVDGGNTTQEQLDSCLRWAVLIAGIPEALGLLQEVIDAGADVNCHDQYDNTPLALAIHFCVPGAVEELLKKGAALEVPGNGMHPQAYALQLFMETMCLLPSDKAFALRAGYRKILQAVADASLERGAREKSGRRK